MFFSFFESLALSPRGLFCSSSEDLQGVGPTCLLRIVEYVQRNVLGEVRLGAHAIDRLLHFAVAPIPSFHSVVGGQGPPTGLQQRSLPRGGW